MMKNVSSKIATIAEEMLASGEWYDNEKVMRLYGMNQLAAAGILNGLQQIKRYDVEVKKDGYRLIGLRVKAIVQKPNGYADVRRRLLKTDKFLTVKQMMVKFKIKENTLRTYIFKLKAETDLKCEETLMDGLQALRFTERQSTEVKISKFYHRILTKSWEELRSGI